jgi:hypothetical protein
LAIAPIAHESRGVDGSLRIVARLRSMQSDGSLDADEKLHRQKLLGTFRRYNRQNRFTQRAIHPALVALVG